jgi:hypothetical protein
MSYYEAVLYFGVKELERLHGVHTSHTLSSYSIGVLGPLRVWEVNCLDLTFMVHRTNVHYIFTFRV